MISEDVCYLKECLGVPLTLALAEITAVQPRDPVHYLGHWLFKYRYNEEMTEKQSIEINELTQERNRIAQEKWVSGYITIVNMYYVSPSHGSVLVCNI